MARLREVDLAVVGAGPAGSAAALRALAVDPDASVLLIDRAAFPRDKTCGDGIGPEAVDVLQRLDAAHALDGFPALDRIRITAPSGLEVRGQAPRPGHVVPRMVFDARLRDAAVDRGAEPMRHRVREVRPVSGGVELDGLVRARTVVAADGASSAVRRALGVAGSAPRHTGVALRGYAHAPDLDELWIGFVADRWPAYAWAFPVGDGRVNVGYGPFDGRADVTRAGLLASLERHLAPIEPEPGSLAGARLPLSPGRPGPARGRVLFAGDAASLVHPLTGEGIYYALLSGAMAGAAALRFPDDPAAAYRGALRARLGRHLRHTAAASVALRATFPVEIAVASAGRDEGAFADLCEFALGTGLVTPRLVRHLTATSARRATECLGF